LLVIPEDIAVIGKKKEDSDNCRPLVTVDEGVISYE